MTIHEYDDTWNEIIDMRDMAATLIEEAAFKEIELRKRCLAYLGEEYTTENIFMSMRTAIAAKQGIDLYKYKRKRNEPAN